MSNRRRAKPAKRPAKPLLVAGGPLPGIPRVPGSVDSFCDHCRAPIYLAPSTLAVLDEHPDVPRICYTCAQPLLELPGVDVAGVRDARAAQDDDGA